MATNSLELLLRIRWCSYWERLEHFFRHATSKIMWLSSGALRLSSLDHLIFNVICQTPSALSALSDMSRADRFRYSELANDDHNMLVRSQWPRQRTEFLDYLSQQSSCIRQLVAHHLSLRPYQTCTVASKSDWICGSFNVCIPVSIEHWQAKRVLVRCPFPHCFSSLDMISENIRGECAAFAWLAEHCPNIPIPHLRGFGLSESRSFTPLVHSSYAARAYEWLRRCWRKVIGAADCWRPFVPHPASVRLKTGYLIMDFIEHDQGSMLTTKWPSTVPSKRQNLFRSFASILLDLSRIPLPRIGALTINNMGEVILGNRPLTAAIALLEAEGIPSDMPPTKTYTTADTYVNDLIHCHEMRLRYQPNAVEERLDAQGQMATIVILKAVQSLFMDRSLRDGPFYAQLTDLHECNIFVDDQCNITGLVDLEFSCSLPLEMQQPPFWLSGHEGQDFLKSDEHKTNERTFEATYQEFLGILAEEQARRSSTSDAHANIHKTMMSAWKRKAHWYFAAVQYPRVAYSHFITHIQPLFALAHANKDAGLFQNFVSLYYTTNASDYIRQLVCEKNAYDDALKSMCNNAIYKT